MSWEDTLKNRAPDPIQNSGEYPNRTEITRMRESYNQLLKIRDSMVESNQYGQFKSQYANELMQQLPTMREVDDMLATMRKIVDVSWDKYAEFVSRRPAFMDRAQEALRQERMNR